MCGITGIFSENKISRFDVELVQKMNDIQKHRGPDDEGIYSGAHCVLGHRRLSIIDLSSDGHQPFSSEDGRFHLVYNGEIYNYIELREELEGLGWQFRTKTDTEVLLKAFLEYGERCLSKFNGMFAFAIYDSQKHSIFFARDRVGIKPLYYAQSGSKLYFASEIKALRKIPLQIFSINYQTLFDYLVFNRTDIFDETFYNEVQRIPKGYYGTYDNSGLKLIQWWNPEDYIKNINYKDSLDTIQDKIKSILLSAVQLRMRSDVPVGSCLSGGLDSSILLGILYHHNNVENDYSTFTASFPGHSLDEIEYVDCLNKRYPFKNYRTFPSADKMFDELQDFVYTNDEPTTNYSFYSQYRVMKLAKEHGITVLLDGQGGDESFAGYQYFHGFYLNGLFRNKNYLRLGNELMKIIVRRQDKLAYQTFLFQILPDSKRQKILKKTLPHINSDFYYEYIDRSRIFNDFFDAKDLNTSLVRHFQYKLEHLLRMEDRNSMAFSLEARVPYLDYRLIEYVLGIPEDLKIKAGETKYLQKKAVGKYTVPEILNRKDKIGFGTPGDEWMHRKEWQDLTKGNYVDLAGAFPDVFIKDVNIPDKGVDRWKINQLSIWKGLS